MAHATTPTGLAKQPATSITNGLRQAFLIAVMLVALVAGTVFVGTNLAAKGSVIPAANHSHDQIEAQRGAVTQSTDTYLNGILDRAHATPFAAGAVTPLVSATSGTFHPGWQPMAPVKRDRTGGR